MNTILMNSENSKTSDPQRLLLNLSDKTNLKRVIGTLLYQILAFTIHGKNIKKSNKNNTFLKYHFKISCGIKNLNYLRD